MNVMNKKTIIAILVVFAVVIIGVFPFVMNSSKEKAKKNSDIDNTDVNVFTLEQISSDNDTVTVQLSLNGKVSICRYSATVVFDSNCLELIDYDEELSAYSPVVYPGKDDKGKITNVPESGIVNLEWASAKNLTKEGQIINLVFNKTEKFTDSTTIRLKIKGVNTFTDDIVVETEYGSNELVVKLK